VQGGLPGAANLGGCGALESIVRRQALKGGLYAAICAAPPLALDAGACSTASGCVIDRDR
jgi:hypothetical protein